MKKIIEIEGRSYEISVPGFELFGSGMVVFQDGVTGVRSIRFVKDTDCRNEVPADEWEEILKSAYLSNYDDNLGCITVEIELNDESSIRLTETCIKCGISTHAFFQGCSKFFCDSANSELIYESLGDWCRKYLKKDKENTDGEKDG